MVPMIVIRLRRDQMMAVLRMRTPMGLWMAMEMASRVHRLIATKATLMLLLIQVILSMAIPTFMSIVLLPVDCGRTLPTRTERRAHVQSVQASHYSSIHSSSDYS